MNATNFNWSPQQKEIFNWFIIGKGNLIVRARAGAAKTSSIIEGLNRANASSALYAVFNKKNQLEAEKKITNKNVNVKTLHSVGFSFILKNWRGVRASGYTEFGRIKKLYPDAPEQVIFQGSRLVSYLKNSFVNPTAKEALDTANLRDIDIAQKNIDSGWTMEKLCEMALKSIELSCEYPTDKQISFDDMVYLPVRMGWVKPFYQLVTIDEMQDLNILQLTMAIDCCLPGGKICMIGDDKQQIYGFRGAMNNCMEIFKEKLNAKQLELTTTYRCPRHVVKLAQTLVPDINAADNAIDGEIIDCNFDSMLNSIKVKDCVLSRTNAPLMKTCLALLRKGISSYVEGRDVGKQLITIIDDLNSNDINDFYTKLDAWLAYRQAKVTGYNAGRAIEQATDQHETLRAIAESCLTVEDIKNKINKLFLDADFVRVPSVVCSTVHKAKGLEWDNVHLLMETFASKGRVVTPEQAQEELNIKYVSYTRAKKKLVRVT